VPNVDKIRFVCDLRNDQRLIRFDKLDRPGVYKNQPGQLGSKRGGIMVVTGKLTLHGNFSFKGMIIVTGQAGVDRSGGGGGEIQGNMVIAPYSNSTVAPATDPISAMFLAPQYNLSGGGNSEIRYNSAAVAGGLVAVSNFVLGVAEK